VTVKLISGNGTALGPDSLVTYKLGANSGAATIVHKDQDWSLISGTQWIGWALSGPPFPNEGAPHPAGSGAFGEVNPAHYSIGFSVPSGAVDPSMTVKVLADNCADIYLNSTLVGSEATGAARNVTTFFTTVNTFSTTTGFNPGGNVLRFDVTDAGGVAGLDFEATITYLVQ
jgi:hypothetical protein